MEKLTDLYLVIITVTLNHRALVKNYTSIFFSFYIWILCVFILSVFAVFKYISEFAILIWHQQNCTHEMDMRHKELRNVLKSKRYKGSSKITDNSEKKYRGFSTYVVALKRALSHVKAHCKGAAHDGPKGHACISALSVRVFFYARINTRQ